LNKSPMNIPSECRSANIVRDHAMILPDDATPKPDEIFGKDTFGWTNPILIDHDKVVIAGHGRLKAAISLGIDRVPTICIGDMTETQKRAYILADNKLCEIAGWDRELLALELKGLIEMNLDFDVTLTGFEMGEIDLLIDGCNDGDDEADELPEADPASPRLRRQGIFGRLVGTASSARMRRSPRHLKF
jgi:hypothetical protein